MAGNDANTKLLCHLNSPDRQIDYQAPFMPGHAVFNGSSSYISAPDSTDWDVFGSNAVGTWTVECWVREDTLPNNSTFIHHYEDVSNWWTFGQATGGIMFVTLFSGGSTVISLLTEAKPYKTVGQWHHCVLVVQGTGTSKLIGIYVDGIQIGFVRDNSTDTFAGSLILGKKGNNTNYLDGHMNEVLIQNSNLYGVTPDGSSLYNGSSAYQSIPDHADWDVFSATSNVYTIDMFAKRDGAATNCMMQQFESDGERWQFDITSSGNLGYVLQFGATTVTRYSNTTPLENYWKWAHCALVKDQQNVGIYANGVQVGYNYETNTHSYAGPLYIGRNAHSGVGNYFDGNIDEVRVQNSNAFSVTPHGAGHFNGTTAYLSAADHADWDLVGSNADNWTVDFWVKHTDHSGSEKYLQQFEDSSNTWQISHLDATGLKFTVQSSGEIISLTGSEITDTDWHHIALIKVADEYAFYLDGIQVGYVQDSSTDTFSGPLYIGQSGGSTGWFDGLMDEVRIQQSNAFSAAPASGFDVKGVFDGSAYLTAPDHGDWTMPSNFTIETFVKFDSFVGGVNSLGGQYQSVSLRWRWYYDDSTGRFGIFDEGTGSTNIQCAASFSTDTWYHLAIVRNSGVISLYIDGVSQSLVNNTNPSRTFQNVAAVMNVGYDGQNNQIHGQLNEYRLSSTARYTTNFTPTTVEFSSDANTRLLLHFDWDTTDSGNTGHTMTNVSGVTFAGDTITVPTAPHTSDSNTHLLLHFEPITTDSGNTGHTITNNNVDYDTGAAVGYFASTITVPTSEHTSDSNTHLLMHMRSVVEDDGNTGHTVTNNNVAEGLGYFDGTGDRDGGLTVPTEPHTSDSNTKLLLHMQGNSLDYGNTGHTMTDSTMSYSGSSFVSPITDSSHYAKFYGHTGSLVTAPDHADWDVTASGSTYTLDMWVYKDNTSNSALLSQYQDANDYWTWVITSSVIAFNSEASGTGTGVINFSVSYTFSANRWYHVAFVKNNTILGMYVDGKQVGYTTSSANSSGFAGDLQVGSFGAAGSEYNTHKGSMAEVRIQNSNAFSASPVVGLTDTIEVPFSKHTSDSNTHLLLHFDGDFTDSGNTGHTISRGCNTLHEKIPYDPTSLYFTDTMHMSDSITKFNPTSLEFDGDSDCMWAYDSPNWDIVGSNTVDWTVEFWCYIPSGVTADSVFISQTDEVSNYWTIVYRNTTGLNFIYRTGATTRLNLNGGGTWERDVWHHCLWVRLTTGACGLYKNGQQVAYGLNTTTGTYTSTLNIGSNRDISDYYEGNIDDMHICKANKYNLNPVSGLTDSFDVPDAALETHPNTVLLVQGNQKIDDNINSEHSPTWSGAVVGMSNNAHVYDNASMYSATTSGTYLSFPDSNDWDIIGSNTGSYTVDWWGQLRTLGTNDVFFTQTDGSDSLQLQILATNNGVQYQAYVSASTILQCTTSGGGFTSDLLWHHYALVVVGTGTTKDVGIYIDGIQRGHTQDNSTATLSAPFYLSGPTTSSSNTYIEEFRVQQGNYFNASPVVGLTDTIEVPYLPYSEEVTALGRSFAVIL